MSVIFWVWIALGLLIGIVWLRRHVDLSRARARASFLSPEMYESGAFAPPRVSVVVAARDEEADIERCIRTLLQQDYPNFEIVAVNDRSVDRTGPILEHLREEAPNRVRIVTIKECPAGWFGKVHAVHAGVAVAEGDYLLFTDADCEQLSDRTITVATCFAMENNIDLLSVTPTVSPACFWETIVQPAAAGVLMFWHPPDKVNNPAQPQAYANGAFMLFSRDAYRRIGGHEPVRHALCEDMQLARNAKAAGLRLHVIQNRGLYRTRMYETLGETWRGWSRIMQGSLQRPGRVLVAAVVLSIISITPWVSLIAVCADRAAMGAASAQWLVAGGAWALAVAAQLSVMIRFYPLVGAPRWRAVTYPLGALALLAVLVNAFLKLLGMGTTNWSGTTYPAGSTGAR